MKYLLLLALILTAACSLTVVDGRSDAQRAIDATRRAAKPYSANYGTLHIRLLTPPAPPIEPRVLP